MKAEGALLVELLCKAIVISQDIFNANAGNTSESITDQLDQTSPVTSHVGRLSIWNSTETTNRKLFKSSSKILNNT